MKMNSINRSFKTFFVAAAVCGMVATADAAPPSTPGDYDGNNSADLAVALVTGNTTAWLSRLSPGGSPLFFQFNNRADAFVTGRFFPDNKTYPGIVTVTGSQAPLLWTIKNDQGLETALNFGLPGDTIPNQGDLDCDGITDLIVTRPGTAARFPGFRLWYAALSSAAVVQEQVFGLATDQVAVGDVNGDGCAELIALRGSDFTWYTAGLFDTTANAGQWGLPGDLPLLPRDLDSDNIPDYTVVRAFGGQRFALVRYSANINNPGVIPLGSDTSIPQVGSFTGQNGFAWNQRNTGFTAVKQPDNSDVVFPFGISTNVIIRPDGTVVLPNQDGRTLSTAITGGECANAVSISSLNSVLYKPINEHGGRGPTLIVKNPAERTGKNRLEIRDINCKPIAALGLQAVDGQYGARYYSKSGGSGHIHTQLRDMALQAGSTEILIEGKGKWIKINNPVNRQGAL